MLDEQDFRLQYPGKGVPHRKLMKPRAVERQLIIVGARGGGQQVSIGVRVGALERRLVAVWVGGSLLF